MGTVLDPHAGVIFRLAWRDAWRQLDDAEVGKLTRALLDHAAGEAVDADALPGRLLPGMYAVHAVQIDMDIAQYAQKIERRREAGRKGGRPRKAEAPEPEAEAPEVEAEAPEAGAEATPEPEEKPAPVPAKKEPAESPLDRYLRTTLRMTPEHMAAWRAWYAAYPRHEAVRDGARAWRDAVRSGVPMDVLQAGAERYAREKAGTATQYIALPATWIRGGRYADEAPKAPSGLARLSGIAAAAARLDAEEVDND